MDTGNYQERGRQIADRIQIAAAGGDPVGRLLLGMAHEAAACQSETDIPPTAASGMERALHWAVAYSGLAEQAVANREGPTLRYAAQCLVADQQLSLL